MKADRHAVVIGAGITGTLVARQLLLAGWAVTVVEAAHIGAGSSSRTAAGIRQQFSTPETVRGMRYSVGFYRAFSDEIASAEKIIIQNGYLFLIDDSEAAWTAAEARVAMQREAGLAEVQLLDRDALAERFPWADPGAVAGATFCPTDGFLLPAIIYNEGARRIRELGAELVQNAPVTGAEHDGQRLVGVHTPKGTFRGDLFLDCTNAWTNKLAPLLGAAPLPVDPIKRYLWFLERDGEDLTEEQMRHMPLTVAPSGVYCRPENVGTLLMGHAHEADGEPNFDYDDQDHIEAAFSHKTADVDAAPFQAWAALAEVLPPVGEFAGITATTAGYYATTPDHNPFLGYDPRVLNLIRLVGFSGHGAMFGPFTGLVAGELAETGGPIEHVTVFGAPVPLAAFALDRRFVHAESLVI